MRAITALGLLLGLLFGLFALTELTTIADNITALSSGLNSFGQTMPMLGLVALIVAMVAVVAGVFARFFENR